MAMTTLDYEAMRALHRTVYDHLQDVQWTGRRIHPAPVEWRHVRAAIEEAVEALEIAGYRIVKV